MSTDKPLFTIVIPTYNRTTYLAEAIESVLQQTYQDWEMIVIDDGSDPPVAPILKAYTDSRIRYVYQSNRGLGLTRQRGVELSRGTLICFLDDDDYYLTDHLSSIAEAHEEWKGKMALIKTGTITLKPDGSMREGRLFSNSRSAQQQHWENPESVFPYAIPIAVAREVPSLDFFLAEDFDWLGRLMTRLPVHQLEKYTAVYRIHASNRSRTLIRRSDLKARLQAVNHLFQQPGVQREVGRSSYNSMQSHQCLHWVRQCIRGGQACDACHGALRALRYFTWRSAYEWSYTIAIAVLHTLGLRRR